MNDTATRSTLLAAYDNQLRTEAEMASMREVTRIGPVLAGLMPDGRRGFVSYADLAGLDGEPLDELITAVIDHFRARPAVASFEWKSRGHDAPGDLADRLIAHGFVADEVETVMVGPATGVADAPAAPAGVDIRQAGADGHDRRDDIARAHAMQEAVFGHPAGSVEDIEQQLDSRPDLMSFWVAEGDGRIVTAGRLTRVEGTQFAGVWGGATDPAYRGRGIYRALTAARARWAIERGVRYLHSDSTDMSRPILERSGLMAVTTTTPYIWSRER